MSHGDDFRIRTMRRDELAFAIELAAQEGWNPGLHDGECFYAADPDGFLIGELHDEAVGCISAVSYGGRYGFVGLYIVRPEFRGQGYGLQLWQAAMARLQGHNVGLDGVVGQQGNYARSGFRLAYVNVRYRGAAEPAPMHASILPAAETSFDAIGNLDREIFPERRDAFLRCWLAQPHAGVYIARDEGGLTGYAVVRPCREGWKLGPLVADGTAIAERLYRAAAGHVPRGDAIFVDIPEANAGAQSLRATFGLIPAFETARMYTGPNPAIDLSKLYGVTTFELG